MNLFVTNFFLRSSTIWIGPSRGRFAALPKKNNSFLSLAKHAKRYGTTRVVQQAKPKRYTDKIDNFGPFWTAIFAINFLGSYCRIFPQILLCSLKRKINIPVYNFVTVSFSLSTFSPCFSLQYLSFDECR